MLRKSFISSFFIGAVIIAGYAGVLAQTSPVSGTVELKREDGSREPITDATIQVYRTDIKAGGPSTKTNKKGEFIFAGLPLIGTYALAVSAPNCSPMVFPKVRPGQEKLLITLVAGDGMILTEDEARKALASKASTIDNPELTMEEKKAQAEYEAKIKDVKDKNEKAKTTNEVVARSFKEGNEAYNVKNYDLAIAKYEEGYAADTEFVGSAPIFQNNRSATLTARAVDTYNKSVRLTDATAKVEGLMSTKKDLTAAAEGFLRAWNIEKNAPAADIADPKTFESNKMLTLSGAKDTFIKAVLTEQVDAATIEAAKILIPEYLNAEKDPVKKAEASLAFADLYRVIGDSENAIAAFKVILTTSPENVDALVGLGLSMVNQGYIKDDKAMLQEGANYLQKFVSLAPDTHKFKANAVEAIGTLKSLSNVTPQKVTTTPKKKP